MYSSNTNTDTSSKVCSATILLWSGMLSTLLHMTVLIKSLIGHYIFKIHIIVWAHQLHKLIYMQHICFV